MKKVRFLLTFAAAALFTVGMTGCSKDSSGDETGGGGNGQKVTTTLTVNIKQSGGNPVLASKAPAGFGSLESGEGAINALRLYIFNGTNGLFESVTDFNNISGPITSYQGNVVSTTGLKELFTIANITDAWKTALQGVNGNTSIADFKKIIQDVELSSTDPDNIAASGNMLMTNVIDKTYTVNLVEEGHPSEAVNNKADIQIGRASAKVTASYDGSTASQPTDGELLGPLEFTVAGIPTEMYTMPTKSSTIPPYLETPHYEIAGYNASDYFNLYTSSNAVPYVKVPAEWRKSDRATTESFYIAENSSKEAVLQGMATRLVLSGVYSPNKVYTVDKDTEHIGYSSGTTFSRIAVLDGTTPKSDVLVGYGDLYYSGTPTTAELQRVVEAIRSEPAGTTPAPALNVDYAIVTYENGVCYYTAWISDNAAGNQTDKYTIHRNHYYWMNITSVSGIGKSNPDGEEFDPIIDPTDPIEGKKANLTADVTVLPWSEVESSTGI